MKRSALLKSIVLANALVAQLSYAETSDHKENSPSSDDRQISSVDIDATYSPEANCGCNGGKCNASCSN